MPATKAKCPNPAAHMSISPISPPTDRSGLSPISHSPISRLFGKLFQPIDAASLAVFRIGFGFIMLVESLRYLLVLNIDDYYLTPVMLFKYYGFAWVSPWPGDGIYLHFVCLAILALFVMLGFCYRLSIVLFTLGFSFIFLLDQALYLNHFYMVILFATLLCIVPAHHYWSLDARRNKAIASNTVPFWCIAILCAQLEIILIYAGLVKLNADWLNLQPLKMWLSFQADFPLLGYLFTQDWSIAVAAYGVILLHLIGAPLLLYRRTQLTVLAIYAAFHLLNHFVFSIGIFPWLTLFTSLLFLPPDWPKRVYRTTLRHLPAFAPVPSSPGAPAPVMSPPVAENSTVRTLWVATLSIWLIVQICIPLRHWIYPGNVAWNEEGHRFSWRMKLRSKSGVANFRLIAPDGRRWQVQPSQFLTKRQTRKFSCKPDMILQFAHFLAHTWIREKDLRDVAVYASIRCSLNGRPAVPFIDPQIDLSKIERSLSHARWVLPLEEKLPSPFFTHRKPTNNLETPLQAKAL